MSRTWSGGRRRRHERRKAECSGGPASGAAIVSGSKRSSSGPRAPIVFTSGFAIRASSRLPTRSVFVPAHGAGNGCSRRPARDRLVASLRVDYLPLLLGNHRDRARPLDRAATLRRGLLGLLSAHCDRLSSRRRRARRARGRARGRGMTGPRSSVLSWFLLAFVTAGAHADERIADLRQGTNLSV